MATLQRLVQRGIFIQVRTGKYLPDPEWLVTATNSRGSRYPIASIDTRHVDLEVKGTATTVHRHELVTFGTELSSDNKIYPLGHDYAALEYYRRIPSMEIPESQIGD